MRGNVRSRVYIPCKKKAQINSKKEVKEMSTLDNMKLKQGASLQESLQPITMKEQDTFVRGLVVKSNKKGEKTN